MEGKLIAFSAMKGRSCTPRRGKERLGPKLEAWKPGRKKGLCNVELHKTFSPAALSYHHARHAFSKLIEVGHGKPSTSLITMATTAPHMSGQPRIPQTLATLCDICSTVDFDLLRVPTAGDMRRLATGEDVLDRIQHRYPFKRGLGNEKPWIIGTLDRVKKSATSCDLCRLVCQRVMELDRDQPGRVNPNNIWRIEIFYINAMVKLPPNARPHPNIIKQNVKEKAEDVIYNVHALNLTWDDPKPDITLWQHGSLGGSGCWMQAFDPSALTDETAVFDDNALADNRLLLAARQTTPKIHPNLIQTWLHECLTKHDEKCTAVQSSKSRLINVLRLIDVQTKSVKRFPEADISSFEYVALSYVWGQAQKLSITRANKDDLAKDGALVGRVSKTIEDAIALTESLGIPYIWVDALCILQDNDDDKMVHLDFMSEIYRYAKLTVIAACGQDAAAPLSGVCEPRHNLCQQHVLKVREATDRQPALYLTTTPEIRRIHTQYSHLDDTFWATRGWTLQEKVVSRRTVIITPYQVYWSCRTSEWTEAMFLETRLVQARILSLATRASFLTGAGTMQGGRSQDDADAIWDQFCVATNNFSQRRLTVQGDAYDAVSSITQEFSAMADVHCIWGIPVSRFELGLCWTRTWERTGQAKLHRRTVLTALPMTSLKCNLPFPSWTWLGWVGTTTLRLQDNEYGDG